MLFLQSRTLHGVVLPLPASRVHSSAPSGVLLLYLSVGVRLPREVCGVRALMPARPLSPSLVLAPHRACGFRVLVPARPCGPPMLAVSARWCCLVSSWFGFWCGLCLSSVEAWPAFAWRIIAAWCHVWICECAIFGAPQALCGPRGPVSHVRCGVRPVASALH